MYQNSVKNTRKGVNLRDTQYVEFITRDKNGLPNPNFGGGVGLFVDEKYKDYEILKEESVFIPYVYESLWIKIKIKNGPDKIIGNVYRPNTAPLANLVRSIEIHMV